MKKKSKKILAFLIIFLFIFEQSGFAQIAGALDLSSTFKSLSNSFIQDKFRPVHLRSLAYNNAANDFRLMLDRGDVKDINNTGIEVSTKALLKYFFIGISIPNDKFWVNLRPDADENIIDPVLARTDAGKILLEADLQLKKDTASATSPKTPEGKEYWSKLYKKAGEIFGSDSVSIPTLTRPWIVPGEIIIRETDNNAYVYKATLKVMLEQDYLKGSDIYNFKDPRQEKLNEYSSELIRKIIIPKLTKEINTSKRYAPLRQLYYSLILAQWFKSRYRGKGGIYAQSIDKERLNGLTSQESWSKTVYFKEYQDSFKNGEYNLKVPMTTMAGQVIRSYFSGGIKPMVEEMPLPPSASSPVRVLGPVTVIYAKRGFPAGSKAISSVKIANLKPSVNDLLSGMVITEDNPAAYSSSPVESDMTRRSWLAAVMGGAVAVAVGTKLNQAGRSSVIEEEGPIETLALKEEVNIWGGYPAGEQVWLNFRDNSNLPAELQSDIYGTNRDGRHNLNNLYIAVVFALLSKTDPFFAVAHYLQEGREDAGMNFDIPGAVLNEEFWVNVIQPRYRKVYGKEIPFSMDSWSGILSDPYLGPFIYRSIVEEKITYYPEELALRSNDFVAANKTNDIKMSAKSIQLYQGFGSISLGNGKYTNYRKAGPFQYQYGYSLLAIMHMLQQGENRKIIDEVIKRAKENIPASMIEKISELDGGIEPFVLPAGNVSGRFIETLNFNAKAKPEGLENAGKKSVVKQVKPENGLFLTGGKIISTAGWLSMATGVSVYAVKFIADWRNESIARQSEDFNLEEFNAARDRILAAKGLNSLDVLHKTVLVVVIKDRLDRQLGRVATLRDIYNQIERMLPSQLESIVDEFEQSISDDEDSSSLGGGSASSPVKKDNGPNANSQKNERRNAVLVKYNLALSDVSPETIYRLETDLNNKLSTVEERILWEIFHENNPELSDRKDLPILAIAAIEDMVNSSSTKPRVLDLGCGTSGAALKRLNIEFDGQLDAWGVDISIDKQGFSDGVNLVEGDIRHLSFSNDSFDLIFEEHTLGYFRTPDRFRQVLEEVIRVLKPGGRFVFDLEIFEAGFGEEAMRVIRGMEDKLLRLSFDGEEVVITKKLGISSSPVNESSMQPLMVDANSAVSVIRSMIEAKRGSQAGKKRPVIMWIDGDQGSGKSFFAKFVTPRLSRAVMLSLDDYINQDAESDSLFFVPKDWSRLVEQVNSLIAEGNVDTIIIEGFKALDALRDRIGLPMDIKVLVQPDKETREANIHRRLVKLIGEKYADKYAIERRMMVKRDYPVYQAVEYDLVVDNSFGKRPDRQEAGSAAVPDSQSNLKGKSDKEVSSPVNNGNSISEIGIGVDNYRKMIKNIKTPDNYRKAVMHFRYYDQKGYLGYLTQAERDLLDYLLQAKRLELGVDIESEVVLILQNLYAYLVGKGLVDERIGSLDMDKLELLGWRIRSAQSGDPRIEPLNERDLLSFPKDILNKEDLNNLNSLSSGLSPESGQASSPVIDKKGGIDFRALPIMNQPMQNIPQVLSPSVLKPGMALSSLNTGKEWQEIENMLNAGIMPSAQRIKDYISISNCSEKEIDKILLCIAGIFRMEEDKVTESEPVLKDLLVLVETKSNAKELILGLNNIKVYSREPIKIE